MKRFISYILVIVLAGIIGNPFVAFSQEEDPFLAINEDESLSEEERFVKAKDGLLRALTLALEKVSELTADLDGRSFDDESRESEIKVVFIGDLSNYREYYSEKLAAAEPLETLEAVQELAQEIKDYRDKTYTPGVEQIVQFILVFYSEDIISIAGERFEKISADIDTLESLGLIEEGSFEEQMAEVELLLVEASDLRAQAKDIILAPQESEDATGTVAAIEGIAEVSTTAEEVADSEPEEEIAPQNLLETSLNNVKTVYEIFLGISNTVKETLGLE